MLLFNHKSAVQTPGKSSYGTEEGGQRQEHQGLGDLISWAESEVSRHRTGNVPQKRDSSQQQDQLKGSKMSRQYSES